MAIVDITAELAARNPSKRSDQIAKTLESLDEGITMLGMVKDSVTLHDEGSATDEALEIVYLRLKRECGALMDLL